MNICGYWEVVGSANDCLWLGPLAGEGDYECSMACGWILLLIRMPTLRNKYTLEWGTRGKAQRRPGQ